jgi:uncharacterized protein (TIGR02246 family)
MGNYKQRCISSITYTLRMSQFKDFILTGILLLSFALLATSAGAQIRQVERQQKGDAAKLAQARLAIGNATAVKAWARKDAAMFVSTFTEDGLELRPDGSAVRGREQILELVRASMRRLGPGVELTVKTTSVWLDGDTAYETGKSIYKYVRLGQPKVFETLFVTIWKKQRDGQWKIVVDMPVRQD